MKVAVFSNYLNHHQLPFCLAMDRLTGGNFTFVATTPVPNARMQFGYEDMNRKYPFVLRTYDGSAIRQLAVKLALEADVVILGSAPMEFLEERLAAKKPTFLYAERLYKTGYQHWKWPVRVVRFYNHYGRHSSLYLLCASAYTAYDFARTGTFLHKTYKWGYFPEVKQYNLDALLDQKKPNQILWAGRFLDWKHPEHVIAVAKRLQEENYDFSMTMLGAGELLESVRARTAQLGLEDRVHLPGSVPADQVRAYMEEAGIYLFTSDRNEGWGAVLNESMNSGCAVVVSEAIGSTPFLVNNGENGLTYASADVDQLYNHVKYLLDHPEYGRTLGRNAYETMAGSWNAETAAQRLIELSEAMLRGERRPDLYADGPCSKAEILKG